MFSDLCVWLFHGLCGKKAVVLSLNKERHDPVKGSRITKVTQRPFERFFRDC